jgi:hypothetical protein
MSFFKERLAVVREITNRRWVRFALLLWAVIAAYDTFVHQFIPEPLTHRFPKIYELIYRTSGWLPWWTWLVVLALIVSGASIEFASKRSRPRPTVISPRTSELDKHIPDVRVADTPTAIDLFQGKDRDRLLPLLEAERLQGWARPMRTMGEPALTKLPGSIWKTHHLVFLPREDFSMRNQTFVKDIRTQQTAYYDVYLNRSEIEDLWPEGVRERNCLIPTIPDFNHARAEQQLTNWQDRVLTALKDRPKEYSRMRTLNLFDGKFHAAVGKTREQNHIEAMWTEFFRSDPLYH